MYEFVAPPRTLVVMLPPELRTSFKRPTVCVFAVTDCVVLYLHVANGSVIVFAVNDNVLFVKVFAVVAPIRVSVVVGSVNNPVFEIVLIIGAVSVLFVSVCVAVSVTSVSLVVIVGKATDDTVLVGKVDT